MLFFLILSSFDFLFLFIVNSIIRRDFYYIFKQTTSLQTLYTLKVASTGQALEPWHADKDTVAQDKGDYLNTQGNDAVVKTLGNWVTHIGDTWGESELKWDGGQ